VRLSTAIKVFVVQLAQLYITVPTTPIVEVTKIKVICLLNISNAFSLDANANLDFLPLWETSSFDQQNEHRKTCASLHPYYQALPSQSQQSLTLNLDSYGDMPQHQP
tara:strand:+ start:3696 stop:4016 length:321 start_codon:yes stop_codon:yes gene_type:complete